MQLSTRPLALALALGTWLGLHLSARADLSGDIQGLHKNDSTNWSAASPWTGSNLQDWQELDYIVVRALLEGGPQTNQPVELTFPKFKTDAPGFQNLYFISNSPNLTISNRVLNAPPAPADWSYRMRVTITNNQTGYIYFYARLAAGAHLNVGSSLQLSGEPSLSPLQIHKPDAGPGSPDLAITKTGPATAGPGDIITYTITYTNKATGSNNTANGVQLTDALPSLVSFVSASDGGIDEAGRLTWDLPDLTNRASGFVTYQVQVSPSALNGQRFTNSALILSSEDDANLLDNRSSVITTVRANLPPVAQPDSYTINEDTVLNVNAPGILANDSDPDPGTTLTAALSTSTSNGDLFLNANGSFTYTPDPNFHGVDQFTYRASDGTNFSTNVTVTITVNPTNDAPGAVGDSYTVLEDTTLSVVAPGVLVNDSDVDGDALTAVLVNDVLHGALSFNSDGSFSYTPSLNYTGVDMFVYRATDGFLSSNATVTITVLPTNDAPVAVSDAFTINEDTVLTVSAPGVLGNDSDVDGDALTAVLASNPLRGSVTLNADGSFSYTPNANYNGTDSFTYRANDGALLSGLATVTITINPTNDAPVALNDAYTMNEDTTLAVSAPGVLGNDSDVDGNPITAVLESLPTHGAVTLNADGSFTYQPNTNYHGLDAFTYRANDGSLTSGVAVVTITINPTNDSPAAANDFYTTPEDTTLTVPAAGVLANDSDVDGDTLTSILVSDVTHGTLALSADGSFSYTPSLNYTGADSFVYRATDGVLSSNATVTITVGPLNDSPVARNDAYSTAEDTTLNVAAAGVLTNDSDVDGDTLASVLVSDVTRGTLALSADGSFSYTPSLNYTGVDAFVYRATDGVLSSNATVTITIGPLNDSPVARNDAYSTAEDTTLNIAAAGVLANDSDVDGDALTSILVSGVAHGTLNLNANGSFSYTPSLNYTGADSFVYRATDGVLSSNATVAITVTPVNDRPVPGVAGDQYTTREDQTLTVAAPGVLANDTDVDGDPLRAILVSGPTHGTLTLSSNGAFVYQPVANYFGDDTFVYVANDGQTSSIPATVSLTVLPVNDAPSFTPGGDQDCNRSGAAFTISGWASNISPGPANESGQAVNFLVSNDNNALFAAQPALAPDGTLTYMTVAGVYGTANVRVRLRDNGGTANGGVDTSSEIVFHIMVNSPPSVTIVAPIEGTGLLNPATFSVVASASDPDGSVTNVQFLMNGAFLTNISAAPFYFILSNVPTGSNQFRAIASDNCGLTTTSAPVHMEVITNAIVATGPAVLNRNNGLFEQYATVSNRTSQTWLNGVRLFVHDLDPTNRVWNATGTNDGVPYIDKADAVPPGGTLQILIQYYVPNPRTTPTARLIAVPKPFTRPIVVPVITKILRSGASASVISFTTQTERFYFLQGTENFVQWTTDPEARAGTGGVLNVPQKHAGPWRFYRVLLIP